MLWQNKCKPFVLTEAKVDCQKTVEKERQNQEQTTPSGKNEKIIKSKICRIAQSDANNTLSKTNGENKLVQCTFQYKTAAPKLRYNTEEPICTKRFGKKQGWRQLKMTYHPMLLSTCHLTLLGRRTSLKMQIDFWTVNSTLDQQNSHSWHQTLFKFQEP